MRRLLVPFISAFLAAGVVSVTGPASACSTILVGKRASVTGHVLVGHNEDDEGELVVNHGIVPARVHAPGTTLEREPGCAAVPQSARTAAFYWSEVRSAECGLSNADAFLNEYGVFIVSNNACADADEDAASTVTDGGIRYVLRRAVAERATSARHAVEIATNLVMTWGYSLPGRMYSFADRDEAWVLQIVKGRRFVARRCPDDQVVAIPNCYTIARLQAGDVVSPDIVARAAAEPGFVFNRSYQGAKRWRHRADVYRWRHMLRIVSGRDPEQTFPFSSSVTRPVRPEDLVRALSTHYEGTVDVAECPHGSLSPNGCPSAVMTRSSRPSASLAEMRRRSSYGRRLAFPASAATFPSVPFPKVFRRPMIGPQMPSVACKAISYRHPGEGDPRPARGDKGSQMVE